MTWLTLWNICVTIDHGYVLLVVNTSWSFPHSWLITGFVTRLTRRVPLAEQELLTLLEHLSLPPVFSGVRVFSFLCSVCRSLFVLFLLAIVLSVLLWLTYFDLVSSNSSYTPFFIVHRNIMHWCKKLSSNTCMRLWGHFWNIYSGHGGR